MRVSPVFRGVVMAGALGALFAPARARAEQMVLFDITYTHTNANDSHYGISGAALKQPSNWTSPINYSLGTIHFYQEVMTKPSDKPTIIDFCLISQRDYGCIETYVYTKVGLVETVRSMAGRDVDKRAVIDFTRPMRSIQMVLKTPAPTYINGGRPQSDFLPSKMRFVATLVSPGGTYVPPTPTPGFDPGDPGIIGAPPKMDAGAPPRPADAGAPPADASAEPPPADASSPSPPTPVPDAGGSTTPPTTPKPDAGGSKPPAPKPDPVDPEPEEETPPRSSARSGGCAAGQGAGSGLALAALATMALALSRRRRR